MGLEVAVFPVLVLPCMRGPRTLIISAGYVMG